MIGPDADLAEGQGGGDGHVIQWILGNIRGGGRLGLLAATRNRGDQNGGQHGFSVLHGFSWVREMPVPSHRRRWARHCSICRSSASQVAWRGEEPPIPPANSVRMLSRPTNHPNTSL